MKRILLFYLLLLAGCVTAPPKNAANVCSIFTEKPEWYEAALNAQKAWGIPVGVQMAIINQESSFVEDARPPRDWFLFIPLSRPSTAYGYSQALDGTWARYQKSTGHDGASRDDFDDAVDFIGWYASQSRDELGIPRSDAYRQYLAYHEGQGGYRQGTHRSKPALLNAARKVASNSTRYERQLAECRAELDENL